VILTLRIAAPFLPQSEVQTEATDNGNVDNIDGTFTAFKVSIDASFSLAVSSFS
jgi:hypothetical protein